MFLMDNIKREIKRLVMMLREKGASEEEIRELFEVEQRPLSRLLVTKDYRLLVGDDRLEVKMRPTCKAVYLLFLNHTEGIRFKDLPDYREELGKTYRSMKLSTQARKKVEQSIINATDPINHSINEKCARIKEAFLKVLDAETATHYYIYGERGEVKRIGLNRELVTWEQKESPPE